MRNRFAENLELSFFVCMISNMTTWNWLAILVIGLTHVVGGIAAFGSSLLAVSVMVAIGGIAALDDSVAIMAFCGLLQSLIITAQGYRQISWRQVGFVTLCASLGIPLGRYLAVVASPTVIRICLGSTLIIGGINELSVGKYRFFRLPMSLKAPILILAGGVHGAFASGGALLAPVMRIALRGKDSFRATIATIWVISNVVVLGALTFQRAKLTGTWPWQLTASSMFPVLAGIAAIAATLAGQRLARMINEERFAHFTAAVMLIAGLLYALKPVV